jgi:hypothetical protein
MNHPQRPRMDHRGLFAQTRADLLSGKAVYLVDEHRRPLDTTRYLTTVSFVGQNRDFLRPDLVETMTRLRSAGDVHVYDRGQLHLTFVVIRRLENSEGMISSEELAAVRNALVDTLAESDAPIVLTRAAIGLSLASVPLHLADPRGTMARLRLSFQQRLKRLGYPPFAGFDVNRLHVNLARFTPLTNFAALTSSLEEADILLGGDFGLDACFLEIANAIHSPQSMVLASVPLTRDSSYDRPEIAGG